MVGKLTTHVLDTANGCPDIRIAIALWKLDSEIDSKTLLKTVKTNHDGRTDEPLLAEEELEVGIYELVFSVGSYFARYGNYPDPLFINEIPTHFGVSNTKLTTTFLY